MGTAMVTARMDDLKKARAGAILRKCGKTPSGAINELYDFIIREGALPWGDERRGMASMSARQIEEAADFVQSIPPESSRFSTMSDEEIRNERVRAKLAAGE